MREFPEKYKFEESEKKWQNFWRKKGIYNWDKTAPRENSYVIDTPPPTVSGQLHIGHVYSYTHTDFIARYRRMKGMNVFYPIGFDDNGLPTERLVEKKKNIRAANMPRQEFIDVCEGVVLEEEEKFRNLFNKIALSVDWNNEYQTINHTSRLISQMSFLDLANKNQVYRDSQPMLWDPVDQTALAQADIEDHEKTTFMNDINFFLEDGRRLIIATTRPELLPACVAVFFHPNDQRYHHLSNKTAISPLFGIKVPLLADDMVDPEKGTGLVMCCTFGDQTDILWWRKHKLPTKIIISKNGRLENVNLDETCINRERAQRFAAQITGLKITDARNKIIELLREEGLLVGQTEKTQTVKCAERSGAPLEILASPQWFIKTVEHKETLLRRSSELNWYPRSMKIKLDKWIEGIGFDWCISRQRYFGVPFPVWYSKRSGEEGKILFAHARQLPVDPLVDLPEGYTKDEVMPDLDVMDTWATSAVSPQLSSHGIADSYMINEQRHRNLFPASLRAQAHEILRTWAFYSILKSHLHEDTLPWKDIMISGWCLAQDKTKMSKSKGNIIVPETLLETYGADIIRYWAASFKLGADTAYSEEVMNSGKRLINKLWNAAKFASKHFDKISDEDRALPLTNVKHKITRDFDKYLINKLTELVDMVDQDFLNYDYASSMHKTEIFFWLFCNNYLEVIKSRAYNEQGKDNEGAQSVHLTLYHVLETLLKLFAPIMPHITEEIFNILYGDDSQSIHLKNSWPDIQGIKFSDVSASKSEGLLEILDLVRKIKAKNNMSIKVPLKRLEIQGATLSDDLILDLKNVTSANEIVNVKNFGTSSEIMEGKSLQIGVLL